MQAAPATSAVAAVCLRPHSCNSSSSSSSSRWRVLSLEWCAAAAVAMLAASSARSVTELMQRLSALLVLLPGAQLVLLLVLSTAAAGWGRGSCGRLVGRGSWLGSHCSVVAAATWQHSKLSEAFGALQVDMRCVLRTGQLLICAMPQWSLCRCGQQPAGCVDVLTWGMPRDGECSTAQHSMACSTASQTAWQVILLGSTTCLVGRVDQRGGVCAGWRSAGRDAAG
jgi:hypothetical protein